MHGSCQPCTWMLHLSVLPMRFASCPPGRWPSSFTYAKRTGNTLFIGAVLYEDPEYKTIASHRYGAPPAATSRRSPKGAEDMSGEGCAVAVAD